MDRIPANEANCKPSQNQTTPCPGRACLHEKYSDRVQPHVLERIARIHTAQFNVARDSGLLARQLSRRDSICIAGALLAALVREEMLRECGGSFHPIAARP